MATNKIKVVLFDLGNVLMRIDFDAFPNELGLYTEEQRAPFQEPIGALWSVYETGQMTTDEFLEKLYSIFNRQFSKDQLLTAWNSIIVGDKEEIFLLVHKVQHHYHTAILSNTSPSHWEKVLRTSTLVQSIPHHFTSFNIGAMKPDQTVYHHVISTLQVRPEEIFFIDDIQENIDGAVTVGMKGVVFKNPKQVEHILFG